MAAPAGAAQDQRGDTRTYPTVPKRTANCPANGVLRPKQEAVALLVASGLMLKDAAKRAGVGVQTAKEWSSTDPAFKRRVAELRSEMTDRALGKLAADSASAAETLGYLARKGKAETTRLMAARAVLELKAKLNDHVELREQLAEARALMTAMSEEMKQLKAAQESAFR